MLLTPKRVQLPRLFPRRHRQRLGRCPEVRRQWLPPSQVQRRWWWGSHPSSAHASRKTASVRWSCGVCGQRREVATCWRRMLAEALPEVPPALPGVRQSPHRSASCWAPSPRAACHGCSLRKNSGSALRRSACRLWKGSTAGVQRSRTALHQQVWVARAAPAPQGGPNFVRDRHSRGAVHPQKDNAVLCLASRAHRCRCQLCVAAPQTLEGPKQLAAAEPMQPMLHRATSPATAQFLSRLGVSQATHAEK
mmetsp:Transcript_47443/g.131908  ORF Transcript_47443/g.131908 Transcript_47443/m.131908 type:complete len:250 (+) Transcript_47443:3-752(+)